MQKDDKEKIKAKTEITAHLEQFAPPGGNGELFQFFSPKISLKLNPNQNPKQGELRLN